MQALDLDRKPTAAAQPTAPRATNGAAPSTARIAVILPCHNEAAAIADVIAEFRASLPAATIYVIDNASSDATATVAKAAGAVVIEELLKGKGNAVRRAFAGVEADVYVLADGDGTYDAGRAPELVQRLITDRLDMIVGTRRKVASLALRAGHEMGNRLFNQLLGTLFASQFTDIFSGYRVLSRRFVTSFPALSSGFEIETEMSVHALVLRLPSLEVPSDYKQRAVGTASKLKTFSDGFRILRAMVGLTRQHRPLPFFGAIAALLFGTSLALFYPVLIQYFETGLVPRMPTMIVCTGLAVIAALSMTCGLILDCMTRNGLEMRRALYLSTPGLPPA